MCDIKIRRDDLKTVTVYKVAMKRTTENNDSFSLSEDDPDSAEYYSWFAGTPIVVGDVRPQVWNTYAKISNLFNRRSLKRYDENLAYWNENMIGRMSGFELFSDAYILLHDIKSPVSPIILEIELESDIMEGSTRNISSGVPNNNTTFAGTRVNSIKDLGMRKNEEIPNLKFFRGEDLIGEW